MPTFFPARDGVELAVHHLGGEGPPLVLSHATGFCAGAYAPLVALLGSRFDVWAIDQRGHGESSAPDNGNFSWYDMAADVVDAVDRLGLREVVAVGHSVGAALTILAQRERPGLFRAAYLYEPIIWPTGFQYPGGGNPMAEGARRRREVFAGRPEALARYAARPPLGLLRADALAAYVDAGFEDLDDGTVRLRCRAESEAATFAAELEVTVDRIEGVALNCVIASGDRGPEGAGPGMLADGAAAALRGARRVRYPHLGHFGPLQDPDTVAADIIAALA